MKKILFFLCCLIIAQWSTAQKLVPSNCPNPTQQKMMQRGYGMFVHFGVNTFTDAEWSDGSIPVEKYNPTELDCDQWVRVARDAGFRYVLLITKHHDGFCLWDSKYTDYDVASSPVKTDVVAEVSKACKKYGLGFAIYYSLWDRKEPSYRDKDPEKYVDYMCQQLTELLSNYGPICELWFDGGWDRNPKDWDLPRVYDLVKTLQPYCAVGVNHTIVLEPGTRHLASPDVMTEDNKYTFHYFPSDFRLWDPKVANRHDCKQYLHDGKSYYLPFEHTICISKDWTWFQKSENRPVRSLDELEELFYWCTDNDNTLVVNVAPDNTGRIREHEADHIIALGKRLGLKRGKRLPKDGEIISAGKAVEATSVYGEDYAPEKVVDGGSTTRWASADTTASVTISLDRDKKFNKIAIFEYCDQTYGSDGFHCSRINRITSYDVEILQDGRWICLYSSDESMGDCKVIRLTRHYSADKLRLNIKAATAPPSIYEINVIDTARK